jgi:CcmD family protein
MRYIFFVILFVLHATNNFLKASAEIEMADKMRMDGKIYVVVAVLSIVFAGIILFLVRLERRLNKLEKENHLL